MNKNPLFKAFALLLFIGGIFGLVTCKHLLVKKTAESNEPAPNNRRSRMHSSKSMPPDLSLMELANDSSIKEENQPSNLNMDVVPNDKNLVIENSPYIRPQIVHTQMDTIKVSSLKSRISSSKSIVLLSEEDVRLLASFEFNYAYGLKSYAQTLLMQLYRIGVNDDARQEELVDSLKKVIEDENWKPTRKDSVSVEEKKD